MEYIGVGASQYLVKPISENKLFSILDKFMEMIAKGADVDAFGIHGSNKNRKK